MYKVCFTGIKIFNSFTKFRSRERDSTHFDIKKIVWFFYNL